MALGIIALVISAVSLIAFTGGAGTTALFVCIISAIIGMLLLVTKRKQKSRSVSAKTRRAASPLSLNTRSIQFDETVALLKSTTNCDTFFGRMEFAYYIAEETHSQKWLDYLNQNACSLTRNFIDRAINAEQIAITSLKTEKGKQNRRDKFVDTMLKAFQSCGEPYAVSNMTYLSTALKAFSLQNISAKDYTITAKVSFDAPSEINPNPLWTDNVSNEVQERFITAVFLNNARKGLKLGNTPDDYPRYYKYDFGISHPEQLQRKLISDGYLASADIKTRLGALTVPEIKVILSKNSLPVAGTKAKLIDLAVSSIPSDKLETELGDNKLTMLTENGQSFLSIAEGYAELFRCGWQISLSEYEAQREKGILNFSEAAEIILKEKDKTPSFSTKLYLAQLYYKQKEYALSLTYYIQTMYYESGEDYFENTSDFAPGNQERIKKMAEYFSEDMIDKCYRDNPRVISKITKQAFIEAVHKALTS